MIVKFDFVNFLILIGLLQCVVRPCDGQFPVDPQPLSLHVLDNEFGGDAAAMPCRLYKFYSGSFQLISSQLTDRDGRILEFLPVAFIEPGVYRMWCAVKDYYSGRNLTSFFPALQITFDLLDPRKDYHIAILLSPFGFSTYRGS